MKLDAAATFGILLVTECDHGRLQTRRIRNGVTPRRLLAARCGGPGLRWRGFGAVGVATGVGAGWAGLEPVQGDESHLAGLDLPMLVEESGEGAGDRAGVAAVLGEGLGRDEELDHWLSGPCAVLLGMLLTSG
jgi:hypothetical protein